MESKRSLVEAYISARYPATRVCGEHFPLAYLTDLYPYDMDSEVGYLLHLFARAKNRDLFERYMLPEIHALGERDVHSDAVTRGETFSIALVRTAMAVEDNGILNWLMDFDNRPDDVNMIHNALGLMHELMTTVYHQPDIAFSVWFPTAAEYAQQQRGGIGQQPVHTFVEQYFLFLADANRRKNRFRQNKKRKQPVVSTMTASRQVKAA